MSDYIHFESMAEAVQINPDSIVSRTVQSDDRAKWILFGFDTGQELSEHTASVPAVIHLVEGEAIITLGEDRYEATAGAWIWMPPHLAHSIYAKTPVKMLLTMLVNPANK